MEIRDKRNELYRKWTELHELDISKIKYKKAEDIRKIETKFYNEWKKYDNFIKAKEKVEYGKKKN
jgi:hypothetical protein